MGMSLRLSLLWESLAVSLMAGLGVLLWSGGHLPGSALSDLALVMAQPELRQPLSFVAAASASVLGVPGALWVCLGLLWSGGWGFAWGISRQHGASRLRAATMTLLCSLSPIAVSGLEGGQLALLCGPLVLVTLLSTNNGWRIALILLCGQIDARMGLYTGLTVALLSPQASLGIFSGILACSLGNNDQGTSVIGLDALAAGLWPGPILGPGPALLLLLYWLPSLGRRAVLLGLIAAAGPMLHFMGNPLIILGHALPLPGILATLLTAQVSRDIGGLVVAAAAGAVGVAHLDLPDWKYILINFLTLFSAFRTSGWPLPSTHLEPPLLLEGLDAADGLVLHLPVEVNGLVTAPVDSHANYVWWSALLKLPSLPGRAPLANHSALYEDPAVVLCIDAMLGDERYLLPPSLPGEALRGQGITRIALHRDLLSPQADTTLMTLYPVWFGAERRDSASMMVIFDLPEGASRAADPEQQLRLANMPGVEGWKTPSQWLNEAKSNKPPSIHDRKNPPPQEQP